MSERRATLGARHLPVLAAGLGAVVLVAAALVGFRDAGLDEGASPVIEADMFVDRGRLETGEVVEGELVAPDVVHTYRLDAAAGSIVAVRLESEEFDGVFAVGATSSAPLRQIDRGGAGQPETSTVVIEADGTDGLLLEVGSADGSAGRYELAAESRQPRQLDVGEVVGALDGPGDLALYRIVTRRGDVGRLIVDQAEFDPILSAYAGSGTVIERVDRGGPGEEEQLVFVAPDDEILVVVEPYAGDAGQFSLSFEPREAERITENGAILGELVTAGGAAVYEVSGAAGELLRVTVDSDELDSVVTLSSRSTGDLQRIDDGFAGEPEAVTLQFDGPDTYLIVIEDFDQGTGEFRLAVQSTMAG